MAAKPDAPTGSGTVLVLTVIGDDRPGVVEEIAAAVGDQGGNWLRSRMARMAGKFAGVAEVEVPASRADGLARALGGLQGQGLRVVVERSDPGSGDEPPPRILELVGSDHPGIVREISRVLHRRGVNIEELDTRCEPAPMSGGMLFRATARLRLPAGLAAEELRRDLESVAHSLMVELRLDEPGGEGP